MMRNRIFKRETILSTWQKTGLFPYKPSIVLDKMKQFQPALAKQSAQRYEDNANKQRSESLRYITGQKVYIDTRNMKTNCPMKKGDDKWAGPYIIQAVYP
jgi:succinate dehydrogenase/fumarate reductase-like Fe-S protein